MSIIKKLPCTLAIASLLTASALADSAGADDAAGKMQFKARVGAVRDDTKLSYNNLSASAKDTGMIGEVAFDYFLNKNIALEGSAAATSTKLKFNLLGTEYSKTLKLFPVRALAQYHFMPEASFSPYVGAGYSYAISNTTDLKSAGSFVLQVGSDIAVDDSYGINLDIKHAFEAKHKLKGAFEGVTAKVKSTSAMAGITFNF